MTRRATAVVTAGIRGARHRQSAAAAQAPRNDNYLDSIAINQPKHQLLTQNQICDTRDTTSSDGPRRDLSSPLAAAAEAPSSRRAATPPSATGRPSGTTSTRMSTAASASSPRASTRSSAWFLSSTPFRRHSWCRTPTRSYSNDSHRRTARRSR